MAFSWMWALTRGHLRTPNTGTPDKYPLSLSSSWWRHRYPTSQTRDPCQRQPSRWRHLHPCKINIRLYSYQNTIGPRVFLLELSGITYVLCLVEVRMVEENGREKNDGCKILFFFLIGWVGKNIFFLL